MDNILGYHVYDSKADKWLAHDEKKWTKSFLASASFDDFKIANEIMEQEGGDYVFACMGSI